MKNRNILVVLMLLMLTQGIQAATLFGKTFFRGRSAGSNLARWMSGMAHHPVHLCSTDCVNGSLFIAPAYGRTYNAKELGEFFFFNGTNSMRFGQAGMPGVDVFARNFFLNDQFEGVVTANPVKQDFVVDLKFNLGLDEWRPGLYFIIDVPLNWTSWDMRLTEAIETSGTTIAANKLGNTAMGGSPAPVNSIISAWQGKTLDTALFPDLKKTMLYGTINGKQSKTSVADISLILGYDFICNDCAHLGLNAWLIIPTGTRPDGQFVFEPTVGNGHHVEFGAGLSGHYELWNNGCDQSFGVYVEGFATHMFRAKQKRTFDLTKNGVGSRYLLFKHFENNMYANEILFGPNVLTRDIKVRNDVHGEVAAMFDYLNGGFTFDVGYNLWGVTRDKITITENIPVNTFGVQGNTETAGATADQTQSLTTINGNFLPAAAETPPVYISTSDLNVDSAAHPGALSHKLFTHLAYTWENYDYLPYIGCGGEVEFSGQNNRAFDQFEVWIKGGFTFL